MGLGEVQSEKSAAAFARLRDAAYKKPGAPQPLGSYTHAERMREAVIMSLFVIPCEVDSRIISAVTGGARPGATVSEDYRAGSFWLNNTQFQLRRVGAEWLVVSAAPGPVP
jgi:hypothetical protein